MIQPLFNGILTLMLAKFLLNDVPHAAGLFNEEEQYRSKGYRVVHAFSPTPSRYDEPPTSGQLRYITNLCQQLKVATPYEEQVKTYGEAGRLIRELEEEKRYRRGL